MAKYDMYSNEFKRKIESFGELIGGFLNGGSDAVTEWMRYDPPRTGFAFWAIGSGIKMVKMCGETSLEEFEIFSFAEENMENLDDSDDAARVTAFLAECIDRTSGFITYDSHAMFHY